MVSSELTNGESVKTIMDKVQRHDIKYVRLIVIDPHGAPRAMLIPEYQIRDSLENGTAFNMSWKLRREKTSGERLWTGLLTGPRRRPEDCAHP